MKAAPDFAENWLRLFARAVRHRDFAAGKKLFRGDSISFGTVCSRSKNLDDLISRQWQIVWPNTRDFDFNYSAALALISENLATIIATWHSNHLDQGKISSRREGRATFVLQNSGTGWQAVHSHFSINPTLSHDPILRHAGASASHLRIS